MRITFLGAVHEVTGSCTLLEVCGKKILVDCGMEQGGDTYENCQLPVSPNEVDVILLTHAHIDHSGMLPSMVARGYKGAIFSTEATARLCSIMLRDSAHIQESEAQWRNRRAQRSGEPGYVPLYTVADAEQTIRQFQGCSYGEAVAVCEGITARFLDAGHLLGSASIYLTIQEGDACRTLLFSGDLGNIDRPLIRDPQKPENADYVVVESTYGDRLHGARPDYIGQLTRILQETFDRGGNVVIPSFAIGRTQELLFLLRMIKDSGVIRGHEGFPVYVDSPLAVEATRIYSEDMTAYYDQQTLDLLKQGINPISFPDLKLSVTSEESKMINFDQEPKVILSASGMCEAGRIRHHLKHNLWRKECTVLFVGYQAVGTVGRKLTDGAASVKLFGEEIQVHANIQEMDGISGHADRDMLLDWLGSMTNVPKQVFVNHGDDAVCDSFVHTVQARLGFPAVAPYSGDGYDLITGECFQKGIPVRISKSGTKRANEVYNRLADAGKRVSKLIEAMKGAPNKELAKLTNQLNSLCEKFRR
ncbi:MAG: MBL fold metallo-hydrolase [Oscillospiraceae bacterium]|nr:MBL fold metallo-hydrolase [Oscillospiraceae bacterium]